MNFCLKSVGFFALMISSSVLLRKLMGSVYNILENARSGFPEEKFFVIRNWCDNMTYFLFTLILICTIFYARFLWKDSHSKALRAGLFAVYVIIAGFILSIPIY